MINKPIYNKLQEYGLSDELKKEYLDKTPCNKEDIKDMSLDELEEDILCHLNSDEWYYKYCKI